MDATNLIYLIRSVDGLADGDRGGARGPRCLRPAKGRVAVLIDTSVLVGFERRQTPLEAVGGDEERAISVVTASELLHGVHRATDARVRMRRHAFVEAVLARLQPIAITSHVARAHAEIWARLESEGSLISAHDLWIAATALAHGMPVATVNVQHFERVPGLDVHAVS